jgi:hypothetical protein
MSLTTTGINASVRTFTPYRKDGNRAVLISQYHTDLTESSITISSTTPKETSNSYGARRSTLKLLVDGNAPIPGSTDQVKRTGKVDVNISLPVGLDPAFLEDMCVQVATLLLDPVVQDQLFTKGSIDVSN